MDSRMAERDKFCIYEQRKNSGKIVGERKYQPKVTKDVEKKLALVSKRINDLQHHRRFAYKNSVKVKKAVHNQINQIIKCFRARERNLLSNVDEAFIAQDSSISDELTKLLSTYARCQTLYENIDDFKEHLDVISKINSILCTANLSENLTVKPLEFTSNFEQMKGEATTYGHLDGEFVKKDEQNHQLDEQVLLPYFSHQNNAVSEQNTADNIRFTTRQAIEKLRSYAQHCNLDKHLKRERSESGDSFEIVDLLETTDDLEDTDSRIVDENVERDGSLEVGKVWSVNEESNFIFGGLKNSCELPKSAKFPDIEKHILEMQQQFENLTSKPECTVEQKVSQAIDSVINGLYLERSAQATENESWLLKSSQRVDKNMKNYSRNTTNSPADLIKKAFSPYFAKENTENWLISKN